jgi:hypothetical protein
MKKILFPVLMLLFAAFENVTAKTIIGTVKDKDSGDPLSGVAVTAPLSKTGTVTDKNGKYSISVKDEEQSLRFSYIGYNTAIIKLNGGLTVNVSMAASDAKLAEVVVTGYGKAKAAVVGSVSAPALESRAVGIAKSESDIAIRGSRSAASSDKKSVAPRHGPKGPKPQSNQLTAGEWNDMEHWAFWNNLMNRQEWSEMQSYWSFYTGNRISVGLSNKQQQPLIGYTVTAVQNGSPVWKAKTNFEGKAELWPSLYNSRKGGLTIMIESPEGKEIYKKVFAQNTRKVNISMDKPAEKIRNLEVLFMVDATGSMGDEISYLKSELEDIIGRLNTKNELNTRTAMVFYRDKGDEYVIRDFGFEQDLQKVKRNLANQYADGGGDFEEAVEEAMENAIYQQRWSETGTSARLMFMILDAPPHYDAARVKSIQRSVKEAASRGIALIPVVASGIDKRTEFLMRFMAIGTNGTYVFLTDDSGIGNSHLKPTVGSYQVEYLNQLLNRLINKYAGLEPKVAEDLLSSAQKQQE